MEGFLMFKKVQAFSLIEILIALVIVSLTAANMYGLQQKVSFQQGDNISYVDAIAVATKEIEKVLSVSNIESLMALSEGENTELQLANTIFEQSWSVHEVGEQYHAGDSFKEVCLVLTWISRTQREQTFQHCVQVNLAQITGEEKQGEQASKAVIFSEFAAQEIEYFNANKQYLNGDLVIYDSYFYQSLSDSSTIGIAPTLTNDRWQRLGKIDNPQALSNIES